MGHIFYYYLYTQANIQEIQQGEGENKCKDREGNGIKKFDKRQDQ